MHDPRHDKLADLLVNYSCEVQPGENVLIECYDTPLEFIDAIVRAVYAADGHPLLELKYNRLLRTLLADASKESLAAIQHAELHRMKNMDAFIGVRGIANAKELSDLPSEKNALWGTEVFQPVHANERVPNTKWVVLRYPTQSMAMMANMSTQAFEDYYFRVTTEVDYRRMSEAMDPAEQFLKSADRVEITGPGTDLRFSIKGIGAVKCDGKRNIPDGEVYTCPVRDSVNGVVRYNTPSSYHGFTFKDIELRFENGKIVDAKANDRKRINEIFDTDEGARYIGEFALGCNPAITFAMDEILFDEKIGGSFHFTPGNAYDDTDNGNRSAVHWDLVCIQTPECGGGEIRIDGDLIRKDGRFVHPAFEGMNPENLLPEQRGA
ncbi:MAG: Aminopeptidase T [Calditrichaeota bacterium]|nr:Aminopeptidase T [Calditrichota bacterium]